MKEGYQRYFTKAKLMEAARRANEWDFNRQLVLKEVSELPDTIYPVVGTFPHGHRYGESCEHHMRCFVAIADEPTVAVDVPWEWYEALPRMSEAAVPAIS